MDLLSKDEKSVPLTSTTTSSGASPPPSFLEEHGRHARLQRKSSRWRYVTDFGSARQLTLAWAWALLTLVFLVLTAVYASQATVASRMRLLYASSSNTIFVLSLLSGFTGVFLAATIAAAFERLQWLLVARKGGLQFSKFLGFQAGTGVAGLLALTAGRGQPLLTTTRLWSATRLLTTMLLPALGILIMSKVNTRMTFGEIDQSSLSVGWGMTPFNGSLARNISLIGDQLSQAQLFMFLTDPSRALEITPSSVRSVPCTHGPNAQLGQSCNRTFFIPGGVEFASPMVLDNVGPSDTDVFLVKDQQSYVLDFSEGDQRWPYDATTDCQVHGFPFAAFQLCLKNAADNVLDARIINCPTDLAARSQCHSDISWHANLGWTTRLTTSFRRATVAFSRSNATIISHDFSDHAATPAPANATDMLQALRDAFGDLNNLQDLLSMLTAPEESTTFPMYTYPGIVWWCLKGVSSLGAQNPALVARAVDTLYCLLAMVLYYCQPSLYARALSQTEIPRDDDSLLKFAADMLAIAPPDTQVVLAGLRYQIVVGRKALTAYLILSGLSLFLCLAVLAFSSCAPIARHVPATSSFPTWDSIMNCHVEYDDDESSTTSSAPPSGGAGGPPPKPTNPRDPESLRRLRGGDLVREAARMKIRLLDTEET